LHRMVKTAFHVSARNKETENSTSDKDSASVEGTTAPALVPTSVAEKSPQVFVLSGEESNVESAIKTIRELIEDETKNPRDMFYERAIPRNKSEKRRYDKQHLKARRLADAKSGSSSEAAKPTSNGKGKHPTTRKGLTSKGSRRKRHSDAENTADASQDASERGPSSRKENPGRRGRGKGKNNGSEGGATSKGKGRGGSGRGGGSNNNLVFKPKQHQGGERNGDATALQQPATNSNLRDASHPPPAKGSNNGGATTQTEGCTVSSS